MNTKPFSRVERVEQELLKRVNQILSKDVDLRKYGFLTFSSIKMTADLKHANIFYSIINPTKEIELINTELNLLKRAGANIKTSKNEIHIKGPKKIRNLNLVMIPFIQE